MSLATRCANCGTVFRVVQDQLKISEGWVRCGRCHSVFNATESLFELATDESPASGAETTATRHPPPSPDPAFERTNVLPMRPAPREADMMEGDTHPGVFRANLAAARSASNPAAVPAPAVPERAPIEARSKPRPTRSIPPPPPIEEPDEPPAPDDAEEAFDADHRAGDLDMGFTVDAPAPPANEPLPAPTIVAESASDHTRLLPPGSAPRFVRQADRQAFWQRATVRSSLWLLCMVMVLALLVQMSLHWRHVWAARWPALHTPLEAMSGAVGLTIEPPRMIEAISVDSSGLTKLEGSNNQFKFSITVRNRSSMMVAMPAIELTLTDVQAQVVARRVMRASDLGASQIAIGPRAEVALQAVMAGSARISGYNAEIFYP